MKSQRIRCFPRAAWLPAACAVLALAGPLQAGEILWRHDTGG